MAWAIDACTGFWRRHRAGFLGPLDPGSRSLFFALNVLLLSATALAAELPDSFDPARDAGADVAHAVTLAKTQNKRVIVDVGGEWCSWCHILDRFIAANDDVRTLIARDYVWVKVNYSKVNRNERFLSRWPRIAGYPHLFVLDAYGALVHSQDTGVLESGNGYDKARVIAFLKRWAVQGSGI
ncbi:MAG TPA: thioredoxin family protein [Casimicrobiaceae bacterium]